MMTLHLQEYMSIWNTTACMSQTGQSVSHGHGFSSRHCIRRHREHKGTTHCGCPLQLPACLWWDWTAHSLQVQSKGTLGKEPESGIHKPKLPHQGALLYWEIRNKSWEYVWRILCICRTNIQDSKRSSKKPKSMIPQEFSCHQSWIRFSGRAMQKNHMPVLSETSAIARKISTVVSEAKKSAWLSLS